MQGSPRPQRGVALLLFLFLLFGIGTATALSALNSSRARLEQERQTQLVLQQAKEALIAYAVSVYPVGNNRPGDLPCPDIDNDGKKDSPCGNASGTTGQALRLGRLPWKSLGLADLRDAGGERLWYAVSNNFKEDYLNNRHLPLNSDTMGTIQVVEANGTIIPNVIAVVIAPGPPIQRLNAAAYQDRSPGNENVPANYLDETASEDNTNFVDGTTNGFINGIVRDTQGRILVNDSMLVITYNDLIPLLEKQVAATVMNCLSAYAAYNDGTENNLGRYPWAASMASSAAGNYNDTANTLFGRIPNLMCNSGGEGVAELACSPGAAPPITGTNPGMLSNWGAIPSCTVNDAWFRDNWREQVFYAIADAYKPGVGVPACGSCLKVGSASNRQVAVLVGRQALAGQDRAAKAVIGNYLEGENATPYDSTFEINATSLNFNDLLVFR